MPDPEVPVIEQTADDDGPASLFGKKVSPPPEVKTEEKKAEQVVEKPPEEPVKPVVEPKEVEPAVTPPALPPVTPTPEEDQIFEVAGISRKKSEWVKREQDAETWRNQASHFQQKYTEVLEQSKQAPKQDPQRQPAPPAQPYTVDDWKKEMDHNVESMVAAGLLEKDSVDVSPDLARGFAALYQEALQLRTFKQQVEQTYAQRVEPLVQSLEQSRKEAHRQTVLGDLNSKVDQVAALGPYYEPLKNPETRNTYLTYLSEKVNPEIARLQAPDVVEFLASQYVAMTRDPLLKSIQEMARVRAASAPPPPDTRNTQGEGAPGASSVKKVPPQKNKDILDLFRGE